MTRLNEDDAVDLEGRALEEQHRREELLERRPVEPCVITASVVGEEGYEGESVV